MMVFLIIFCISYILSALWVNGIDKMMKDHPEYKGEDFLE
jgi:hypothetical protein